MYWIRINIADNCQFISCSPSKNIYIYKNKKEKKKGNNEIMEFTFFSSR